MDQIFDRLYLGDIADGKIAAFPLTATMNLAIEKYDAPDIRVEVLHRWVPDRVYLEWRLWDAMVEELRYLLRRGEHVLVHCRMGRSRSPSLLVAYLASCGMAPETALAFLKAKRAMIDVHPQTWQSVLAWHARFVCG